MLLKYAIMVRHPTVSIFPKRVAYFLEWYKPFYIINSAEYTERKMPKYDQIVPSKTWNNHMICKKLFAEFVFCNYYILH